MAKFGFNSEELINDGEKRKRRRQQDFVSKVTKQKTHYVFQFTPISYR